jgi:uncharacterized membrane protein
MEAVVDLYLVRLRLHLRRGGNWMSQSSDDSIVIAHLGFLQGVISRMGANSFALKALSAAFGSAAIALSASSAEKGMLLLSTGFFPILIFWIMDAQYLKYERAYRSMYERVRRREEIDPFSLSPEPFMSDAGHVLKIAISWSVAPFYISILFGIVIIFLIARL